MIRKQENQTIIALFKAEKYLKLEIIKVIIKETSFKPVFQCK